MFTSAFLEECGNGKLRHEEQLLRSEFERRGVPVVLYTAKRIHRRQLPLSRDTFIAGDVDAMHGAMRQMGIEIPAPHDYPACLASFMHRRVWPSTLGAVQHQVMEGGRSSVFAKPSSRSKSFTGRVFDFMDDLASTYWKSMTATPSAPIKSPPAPTPTCC